MEKHQLANKIEQMLAIKEIQGQGLSSPYVGRDVIARGVVTGVTRQGFFIQTPRVTWDGKSSDGIFVYGPKEVIEVGTYLEVAGEVVDYLKHETAKPVTQIRLDSARVLNSRDSLGKPLEATPVDLTQEVLPKQNTALAALLNSLEGMLIRISAGQTFIAPSNPFGDYVVALDAPDKDESAVRTTLGGALASAGNEQRWFPGFRISNYSLAPRVNVGAKLLSDVVAPLNYRADSYQLSVSHPIKVEPSFVSQRKSTIKPSSGAITVMTLNCFNLDSIVESETMVLNPRQDIDDDWGEGRFHSLARAVVLQANCPDVVALQEIQDNDGAEQSEIVDASETFSLLVAAIEQLCDIRYEWLNINPSLGEDGGQPGGNIRNGFLYNPKRLTVEHDSLQLFAEDNPAYEGSRKPLIVTFIEKDSNKSLSCINVHLASKRHQASIFAPHQPGVDAKLAVRVAQGTCLSQRTQALSEQGKAFYVTGDFNDTEHSETLREICGSHSENMVHWLDEPERYDYNHRGKLQVLMHGIIGKHMNVSECEYEIIHGNELIGVKAGEESDKASDHAYVIAKIAL